MSLQIVTVEEIEKKRNKRYDISDRRVLSRDLLGEYSPKNFRTVFIFMWLGK